MSSLFQSAPEALGFIKAGRAVVTVVSLKTGVRYTYRVQKAKGNGPARYFVNLLTGPSNEFAYTYLGMINEWAGFHLTANSKMTADSVPVKAFQWVYNRVSAYVLPSEIEIWHEGKCGRCGRKLTVPESIACGLGPECAGKAA